MSSLRKKTKDLNVCVQAYRYICVCGFGCHAIKGFIHHWNSPLENQMTCNADETTRSLRQYYFVFGFFVYSVGGCKNHIWSCSKISKRSHSFCTHSYWRRRFILYSIWMLHMFTQIKFTNNKESWGKKRWIWKKKRRGKEREKAAHTHCQRRRKKKNNLLSDGIFMR